MSSNFRALFHLQFNQWAKYSKSAHELWPLSIDENVQVLSEDEMYARNARIIAEFERSRLN